MNINNTLEKYSRNIHRPMVVWMIWHLHLVYIHTCQPERAEMKEFGAKPVVEGVKSPKEESYQSNLQKGFEVKRMASLTTSGKDRRRRRKVTQHEDRGKNFENKAFEKS